MLALDPTVVDAIWASFAAYLPKRGVCTHPLGCHRPRISERDCFEAILFRLVTGCSWDVAGRLGKGSETTLRRRRDEWVAAGAFEHLVEEAIGAFDKVIGLDLSEVSVDGSLHKAPAGGEGTGPNPTDRGKTGWKWSLATDTNGVPIGWVIDGANRNDSILLAPTLDDVAERGCSATSRPSGSTVAMTPPSRSRRVSRSLLKFSGGHSVFRLLPDRTLRVYQRPA